MSDFTDAVRAAVTDEWRTTRQIADSLGLESTSHVARTLRSEARWGVVELDEGRDAHGRREYRWRRVA